MTRVVPMRIGQWIAVALVVLVQTTGSGSAHAETATLTDGIWAETPAECSRDYMDPTTRMELSSGVVKFYETQCKVGRTTKVGGDRVTATATCQDPDGSFPMTLQFRIIDSATVVQSVEGASPVTRHLCASGASFVPKPAPQPPKKEACGQVDPKQCIRSERGKSQNTWRVKNICPFRVAATLETTVPPSWVRKTKDTFQFGKAPSAEYHGVESGSEPIVVSASCTPG